MSYMLNSTADSCYSMAGAFILKGLIPAVGHQSAMLHRKKSYKV